MTTVAVLVWSAEQVPLDVAERDAVNTQHGRFDAQEELIVFPGAAEAIGAAGALLRAGRSPRVVAITLTEVERDADTAVAAAAAQIRPLLTLAAPGDILATELVRLLQPQPVVGVWATTDRPGVHRLVWPSITAPARISVVVAEDVAIIRAGIVSLLTAEGMDVVGEAADYQTILDTVRATRPRLLITDVRMPPEQGDEGLRAAALLRSENPELAVLVLSQHVQASAAADLLTRQTSGLGYLLKERVTAFDEFLQAARTVADGGTVIDPLITQQLLAKRRSNNQLDALGDRERAVLELMAQGLSNVAIADRLTLSGRTVESHVRSIMTKLDLWEDPTGNRRVQAVIRWLDQH